MKVLEKGGKVVWMGRGWSDFVGGDDRVWEGDNGSGYSVGGVLERD